jgi:peptide/nickel transport system substrate-binding protein
MRKCVQAGAAVILVVALMGAIGCGGSGSGGDSSSSGTMASKGVTESKVPLLRIGRPNGLDSMNPGVAQGSDAVMTSVYPKLAQYSADASKIIPDLALSWKGSNGGKTWTFKIAQGGKWSDGKPVTAADAAFTINTYVKYGPIGAAGNYAGTVAGITTASAPDSSTLVVNYKEPLSRDLLLANLLIMPVLPEHIWSQHTGDGGQDLLKFSNVPAVTGGAFSLKTFRKGEIAVMERNENYYGEKAKVKQIALKAYTSPDAMIAALKAGDLDLVLNLQSSSLPAIESDSSLVVDPGPLFREDLMFINGRPGNSQSPSLKDPKVREAIDLAIDRDNLTKVLYAGTGKAARGMFPPDVGPWHDQDVAPVFDADRAKQLLDDAGYTPGPGGVRAKAGQKLSYTMLIDAGSPEASRRFQLIKADLADVGIAVTAVAQDLGASITTVTKTDKWDLFQTSAGFAIDPDLQISQNLCGAAFKTTCVKRYDELADQQRLEQDTDKRVELVHETEQVLADERTVMVLGMHSAIVAFRKGWQGIVTMPDSAMSYFGNLTAVGAYHD